MEPFKVAAQSTEPLEPRPRVVPFAGKSEVERSLVFGPLMFPLRLFEGFELAHLGGFTLGIPAPADHVTRLTRDPSVLKGSERATEECLRALLFSSLVVFSRRVFSSSSLVSSVVSELDRVKLPLLSSCLSLPSCFPLSATVENEAIATGENEATQTDWVGDLGGRLGVDQAAGRGRSSEAAGREAAGDRAVDSR